MAEVSPQDKSIAAGRWLFAQECTFELSVASIDALPQISAQNALQEVAFIGRSNVGKSSLLNALVGRKSLARTSTTPGRTQHLNFFRIKDTLYLVDMPGYGYARESRHKVRQWQALARAYLKARPTLRRVFILIDARHGIKKDDLKMFDLLDTAALSYQLILTKADKCTHAELTTIHDTSIAVLHAHPAAHPTIITTSSLKARGCDVLRENIAQLVDLSAFGY